MVFTIYGRGGHLVHVTKNPANKLSFPLPKHAPHKIWLSSAMQFQRRRCLKFSHVTYVSKIYLDVKYVKVIPGSSFSQTMTGWGSLMIHTKFRGNRPAGSGEEDFLVVFTIYERGGHLGHGDPVFTNKLSFHISTEAPHKIWLSSAKRFQRRRSLKSVYSPQTGQGQEMTLT